MASLYLLIPVAIIFFGLSIALFLWAVKNRQFDDLDKEGQRILFEQPKASPSSPKPSPRLSRSKSSTSTAQPATSNADAVNSDNTGTQRNAEENSGPARSNSAKQ